MRAWRPPWRGDGVPEGMGNLVFDFQAGHEEEGLSIREMPRRFLNVPVVFLAAREVLTIYPSFVQVGSRFPRISGRRQLGPLPLSGYGGGSGAHQYGCRARGCQAGKNHRGKVVKRDGRFFLQRPGQQPIEMSLVAEGFKKAGNAELPDPERFREKGSVLFWDEPEMNLNASHLPVLVKP